MFRTKQIEFFQLLFLIIVERLGNCASYLITLPWM